jgi:hypothetical protein
MNDQFLATFDEISKKVDAYIERTSARKAGKAERWMFVIALLAAGFGMLVGQAVGGHVGLGILKGGLFVECLAFALYLVFLGRREWDEFAHAHRSFAMDLDRDYVTYHEFVSWLGQFSDAEIGRRLRYLRDRKQMMTYRVGLFTGGLERFGVLPVLVALYLQFKDWRFGDWDAFGRVHMIGGLLLWALLLAYIASWLLIRLRIRLDVYEALLAERLQLPDPRSG